MLTNTYLVRTPVIFSLSALIKKLVTFISIVLLLVGINFTYCDAQGRNYSKLRLTKYESDKIDSVFTSIINKKYPELLVNVSTKFLTRPLDQYGFYPKLPNGKISKSKVYECTIYLYPGELLIDNRFFNYHIYNFNTGYFTLEEVIDFAENPVVIAVDATLGKYEYLDNRYTKE